MTYALIVSLGCGMTPRPLESNLTYPDIQSIGPNVQDDPFPSVSPSCTGCTAIKLNTYVNSHRGALITRMEGTSTKTCLLLGHISFLSYMLYRSSLSLSLFK